MFLSFALDGDIPWCLANWGWWRVRVKEMSSWRRRVFDAALHCIVTIFVDFSFVHVLFVIVSMWVLEGSRSDTLEEIAWRLFL